MSYSKKIHILICFFSIWTICEFTFGNLFESFNEMFLKISDTLLLALLFIDVLPTFALFWSFFSTFGVWFFTFPAFVNDHLITIIFPFFFYLILNLTKTSFFNSNVESNNNQSHCWKFISFFGRLKKKNQRFKKNLFFWTIHI